MQHIAPNNTPKRSSNSSMDKALAVINKSLASLIDDKPRKALELLKQMPKGYGKPEAHLVAAKAHFDIGENLRAEAKKESKNEV